MYSIVIYKIAIESLERYNKELQMKKILVLFVIVTICLFDIKIVQADSNETSNDDILNNQEKELGISDFIKSSKEYTKDNLYGIDLGDVFKSAITGQVGNINIFNSVLNIFGREFKSTISSIRSCFYNNSNT